jgi:hypothetical protein
MVDVKSEGKAQGFPTFGVSYNHADGTFDSFTFAAEGGFHDWQQYIGDYVVTQDYVSIDYTLTFGGAEHVWYDNVVLIPCVGVTG